MRSLHQISNHEDMTTALRIVQEEHEAKKVLTENLDKFTKELKSAFEVIDLGPDLQKQKSFNMITASDGSSLRFETTTGHLEKIAIAAVCVGGHTNTDYLETIELLKATVVKPNEHPKDIAKLTMQDMEYCVTVQSAERDVIGNCVHLLDGGIASLLWSIVKMNHFDYSFALNSDPYLMETLVFLAKEGLLVGSPKKISNVESGIISLFKADIPNVDLLSEKYILSKLLQNNELIVASTNGRNIVNQVSTSGFGRKTNDGYTSDSKLANLVNEYKSLFINDYRSVFLKIGGNPFPIKLEFLNPSMLNNFNFLKGIEIEMNGITPCLLYTSDAADD